MTNKEKELREEFQNFADRIIWSNDDGSEKYIGVGNMADWWIKKIDLLLKSKQEALTRLVGLYGTPICDHLHHNKKQRHTGCEICPVVKEINDLKPIITNLLK